MNQKPKTTPTTLHHARAMRREPTKAENLLWQRLRRRQVGDYKFRRQHPIGRYIVDFYCHEARLIIEVDGDVHAFQEAYDAERAAWLEGQGYQLVRFSNLDVLQNLAGVLEAIYATCGAAPSP